MDEQGLGELRKMAALFDRTREAIEVAGISGDSREPIIECGLAALEARPHLALALATTRQKAAEAKAAAELAYIEAVGGEKALGSNAEARERALTAALASTGDGIPPSGVWGASAAEWFGVLDKYQAAQADVTTAAAELAEAEGDIALYLADLRERELACRERELVARAGVGTPRFEELKTWLAEVE